MICSTILLEYIIISSKYIITNSPKWLCKTWFINRWKIAEALYNSKDILRYSYYLQTVTKAVLGIFSFWTLTCQYPAIISIMIYTTAPSNLSNIMQKLDKGLASLIVTLFNSVVSLQNLIFYLTFNLNTSTIVIGDVYGLHDFWITPISSIF